MPASSNAFSGLALSSVSSVKDNREPVLPDTYVLVISSLTNNNPENYYLANVFGLGVIFAVKRKLIICRRVSAENYIRNEYLSVGTAVYYKVSGDNHSDATGSFTVVINKKKITSVSGITAGSIIRIRIFEVGVLYKLRCRRVCSEDDAHGRPGGDCRARSGNYTGTKSITFEILPVEFASVSATPYGGADIIHGGKACGQG